MNQEDEIGNIVQLIEEKDLNNLDDVRLRIKKVIQNVCNEVDDSDSGATRWKKENIVSAINSYKYNQNQSNYVWLDHCTKNLKLFYTDEPTTSEEPRYTVKKILTKSELLDIANSL